ncbi:hypothetical protein MBANPS3_000909 [Mucor bainieri]
MRLRIRHAEGMATLSDAKQEDTVSMLKDAIKSAISLDAAQDIQISGGYPPKPFNDMSMSLKDAGLRDGDTLNIKSVDTPISQQQQPVSSSTASTASSNAPSGTLKALKEGSVQTVNGILQLRLSSSYVLRRDTTISAELRQVIVDGIKKDPDMYSDVTLGQPRGKFLGTHA